jgi:hypothetical protein
MLPFLKRDKEASVSADPSVIRREPDEDSDFDSLEMAFKELCDAIHSKNYSGGKDALKAFFELCDEQPHVEGPHKE